MHNNSQSTSRCRAVSFSLAISSYFQSNLHIWKAARSMAKSNMGGLMLAGMCEQTIVGPNLRRATLLLVHSLPPSHPLTSPIHILVLGTLFIHMLNSKRAYLSCFFPMNGFKIFCGLHIRRRRKDCSITYKSCLSNWILLFPALFSVVHSRSPRS